MNVKYSIDRSDNNDNVVCRKSKIVVKIPDCVSDMVVKEILSNVGGFDWNNPTNVSKTIAKMMSIDLETDISEQSVQAFDMDRTVLVPSFKNYTVPYWICQSLIRVDERFNNRYIDHKGSKYNKIDIIFGSEYFKKQMDIVAEHCDCTWNARWGNSKNRKHRLYEKTRDGDEESWLEKCVKPLLTKKDTNGIDIKNLVMIEFKKKN